MFTVDILTYRSNYLWIVFFLNTTVDLWLIESENAKQGREGWQEIFMQIFECTGIHAPKCSVVYTTMNAHIRSLGQGQVVITYGNKNVGSSRPIPLFRATQRTCFITILKFASIMLLARSL